MAAQTNLQLIQDAPTAFSFEPVSVAELRKRILDYHEHVLNSSVGTVNRYRAATKHVENFANEQKRTPEAHEVRPDGFASCLRQTDVAPNGHKHSTKRKLRDKGLRFILETCRSMYSFAIKRRHMPPYLGNPFSELPLDRFRVEDAKPILVFDETIELAFFEAASDWAYPIHFTLAKTGLRVGELTHLLIEDVDLERGWLHVRNKTELGWRIKTGHERAIPLLPEVVAVLRATIGPRHSGPVFMREKLAAKTPKLVGSRAELKAAFQDRLTCSPYWCQRIESSRFSASCPQGVVGCRASEIRYGANVISPDNGSNWSPGSNMSEVMAPLVCHASPRRQHGSSHPPANTWPQAYQWQWARHDGKLHPHTTGDTAAAD